MRSCLATLRRRRERCCPPLLGPRLARALRPQARAAGRGVPRPRQRWHRCLGRMGGSVPPGVPFAAAWPPCLRMSGRMVCALRRLPCPAGGPPIAGSGSITQVQPWRYHTATHTGAGYTCGLVKPQHFRESGIRLQAELVQGLHQLAELASSSAANTTGQVECNGCGKPTVLDAQSVSVGGRRSKQRSRRRASQCQRSKQSKRHLSPAAATGSGTRTSCSCASHRGWEGRAA